MWGTPQLLGCPPVNTNSRTSTQTSPHQCPKLNLAIRFSAQDKTHAPQLLGLPNLRNAAVLRWPLDPESSMARLIGVSLGSHSDILCPCFLLCTGQEWAFFHRLSRGLSELICEPGLDQCQAQSRS